MYCLSNKESDYVDALCTAHSTHLVQRLDYSIASETRVVDAELLGERFPSGLDYPLRQHRFQHPLLHP